MLERVTEAQNSHDARRMASYFADDYVSVQPVHPARADIDDAVEQLYRPPARPAT
jgi:ketosteroid isomerase-like protein